MPGMSNSLVARTAEALALFEQALAKTNQALGQGDLSAASFPLTGGAARLELQTRASQLQWVLEMLPSQHELQAAQQAASDASQLRAQAAALLAQAAEMDGSDLYIIVHEHEYGQTPYFSWGAGFPSEDEAAGVINATSRFEPHRGEGITLVEVGRSNLPAVCGVRALQDGESAQEISVPEPRG